MKRRSWIKNMSLGVGMAGLGNMAAMVPQDIQGGLQPLKTSGKIRHSVCRWCYQDIPLPEFARACADMGISAIDLLKPSEWETVEKEGLVCSMATDEFASITHGFNDVDNHARLQKKYRGLIKKAGEHGIKNVICFSGNRNGMSAEVGIENCVKGLRPLLDFAAQYDVNLVMELLNSKVDHKDYMCDNTRWGVALAKAIDRPNFQLLYDIYHMQIMEGDVIRTIKENQQYINHYHTGGVPGRNEINDSQELFYPAIIKAIYETGFKGYVAQEFIPTYENKLNALREAIQICDI